MGAAVRCRRPCACLEIEKVEIGGIDGEGAPGANTVTGQFVNEGVDTDRGVDETGASNDGPCRAAMPHPGRGHKRGEQ